MAIWTQDAYRQAYWFAAQRHQGQCYPGTELPYLVHLSFVGMEAIAALQHSALGEYDQNLVVQCALLHDVLEDTPTQYAEVVAEFGVAVADGVLALTKDPQVETARRMQDSLDRLQRQPREIQLVKLADRVTNLHQPPAHWSPAKIAAYQQEAIAIHRALHRANAYLGDRLLTQIQAYGEFVAGP